MMSRRHHRRARSAQHVRARLRLSRGARQLAIIASALVVASAVGVLLSSASHNNPVPPVEGGAHGGGAAVRVPAHRVSVPRPDWESRAIDAVLAYTPFVTAGRARRRAIALTFDDGPGPYTPAIVRILVRLRVPATFFVVGQQLNDFSAFLRDELEHGFVIGDHTENHAALVRLPADAQYGQIHDAAIRIERLGAPFPRLFRPPYGTYNAQTLSTLRQLRMLMVLWSIDPGDWRRPGVPAIVSNVLSRARPGAIVIMHDGGGDRSQTIAALPAIIAGLRRRHYELVTVPGLLRLDPPPTHQRLPRLIGA